MSILIVVVCAVLLVWAGMVATSEANKPAPRRDGVSALGPAVLQTTIGRASG